MIYGSGQLSLFINKHSTKINNSTKINKLKVNTITKPGDIYEIGNHRLICGDATNIEDVLKLLNNKKADLGFNDPPYGMKKEKLGVVNDNMNYKDLLIFNKKWN